MPENTTRLKAYEVMKIEILPHAQRRVITYGFIGVFILGTWRYNCTFCFDGS